MTKETDIYLFDEFKNWLKERFNSGAESDYPSRLKRLNKEYISKLNTGTKYTPFDLLKKYMTASEKGPKKNLIKDFLEAIQSCVTKGLEELKNCENSSLSAKEFSNQRSAFRKYKEFLKEYVESNPYKKDKTCPTERAVIDTLNGDNIVWSRENLISNFAGRITSQDRQSGNKTLLPLGLLVSLGLNLREWGKEEAEKVIFHLANRTVTAAEVENLYIDVKSGLVTINA